VNLIFFTHPDFLGHQSMPRFANMLTIGMKRRGHSVDNWRPTAFFSRLPAPRYIRKWLHYVDQYLLFPMKVRRRLKAIPKDTLFVFTDQALGPWVPTVTGRPHVIHCHDFLALRSAIGEIPENPTGWSGRQYQEMIRRGFSRGKYFISVSHKTKDDLHRFLPKQPDISEVVYNGFHKPFDLHDPSDARRRFGEQTKLNLSDGYILHVGANTWYKNRWGVLEVYDAWRSKFRHRLPLLMIGNPTDQLLARHQKSAFKADIHWLSDIRDESLQLAYAGATVLLFPSLGEGFGWPIAEAMACGCPVITTDEAPMTEVAGSAGFFIARMPRDKSKISNWAEHSASVVQKIVACADTERNAIISAGIDNAKRFDTSRALDQIEKIYERILEQFIEPQR
jgi:glycosyltransferase involved in cell wall biosynthesis